jgi:hypothetical protein
MPKLTKILFAVSLGLFALSYPVGKIGERAALAEMAKYPPDFVEAHKFDMPFIKFVLPGTWLLFSALGCAFVAVILWIVQRARRQRLPENFSPPSGASAEGADRR